MRLFSFTALVASTVLFAFTPVVADAQTALVAGNDADATALTSSSESSGASDWPSSADGSNTGDGSNASDGSNANEGSLPADETPAPTTPTPTEAPSLTPTVTSVRLVIKYKPLPKPVESLCGRNQDEMSVEGVEGVFCVKKGNGCSGDRAQGKCPGRQTGLPHGSYCGRVVSGVYGCKPGMPYGQVPDFIDLDRDDDDDKSSTSGSGSA